MMCFSGEMSLFFALFSVAIAAVLIRFDKPKRCTYGVLYFGSMELLQFFQYRYIAVPEDGYSMCQDPTNQFLTFLGLVHIWFQPYFAHMIHTSKDRVHDIRVRILNDFVMKLALLAGVWGISRYFLAAFWPDNPHMAPRPTADCPNYEWVREGYDGLLGDFETPNLPGHSCTFRSNTRTAHLAWSFPMYQSTYFLPGMSLHCFMMYGPIIAKSKSIKEWPIAGFATGPLLAVLLTNSLNEQGAVWCFFSIFQVLVSSLQVFFHKGEPAPVLEHAGSAGEPPLTYALTDGKMNEANGHHYSNGKKVN